MVGIKSEQSVNTKTSGKKTWLNNMRMGRLCNYASEGTSLLTNRKNKMKKRNLESKETE